MPTTRMRCATATAEGSSNMIPHRDGGCGLFRIPRRRRDRRGATAVIFALSIFPLVAMIAVAVDFGTAVSAKARLDLAADAGVMAGVMAAANDLGTNPANYLTVGAAAAKKRFLAQAGTIGSVSQGTPAASLTRSGSKILGT